MYIIKSEATFDSAHFLYGYKGKCSNLHGHTWKVLAEVYSENLVSEGQCRGMVIDFGDLKRELKALADSFDHTLIYEKNTLRPETISALESERFSLTEVNFRPTAENFAYYFFKKLTEKNFRVKRVSIWETPQNCAVYEEEKNV